MKKKIIFAAIIFVLCAGLFILCILKKTPPQEKQIILENSYSREAYLNIKGWDAEEISCETIRIPENFDGIYAEYAKAQEKQKLPLEKYKGKEVTRFLYNINNYGSDNNVFAELLISENRLIAAALIENKSDGFISPLIL